MAPSGSTVPTEHDAPRPPLVSRELRVPFVLLILCFAAWGAAANLTDILVGVFRSIFDMSNFQSSLVQFAYYGAYFALAIPAGFITNRFGYKTGVLTGLGLAAIGGVLFLPASQLLVYEYFLLALFVLAAGLSILGTSANPFVISLTPPQVRRAANAGQPNCSRGASNRRLCATQWLDHLDGWEVWGEEDPFRQRRGPRCGEVHAWTYAKASSREASAVSRVAP